VLAFTLQAATHTANTFVIIAGTEGPLLRVIDLNAYAVQLCNRAHLPIEGDDIRLEGIEGRSVSVSSPVSGKVVYHLRLALDRLGSVRLLAHRAQPWAKALKQRPKSH
jgi:hypothetical protein